MTRSATRATLATITLVTVLLAGCTQGADGDEPGAEPTPTPGDTPPANTPTPAAPTGAAPPPGATVVAPPGEDETAYLLDQAELSYTNAVKRWELTSPSEANFTFNWAGRIANVYWDPVCLAGSIHGDDGRVAAAFWPGAADPDPKVRVAGSNTEISVYPSQPGATTPWLEFSASGNGTLTPGERLVIELGGSSDVVFGWSSVDGENATSAVHLSVVGDHDLVALPDAPLACGSGAEAAEGSTVGATVYVLEAEVGGTVAMTTQQASTMMLATGTDIVGANEFSYDFLGETATFTAPMTVDRSSPDAGVMEATFHQEVSLATRGLSWLFVDSDWELS